MKTRCGNADSRYVTVHMSLPRSAVCFPVVGSGEVSVLCEVALENWSGGGVGFGYNSTARLCLLPPLVLALQKDSDSKPGGQATFKSSPLASGGSWVSSPPEWHLVHSAWAEGSCQCRAPWQLCESAGQPCPGRPGFPRARWPGPVLPQGPLAGACALRCSLQEWIYNITTSLILLSSNLTV